MSPAGSLCPDSWHGTLAGSAAEYVRQGHLGAHFRIRWGVCLLQCGKAFDTYYIERQLNNCYLCTAGDTLAHHGMQYNVSPLQCFVTDRTGKGWYAIRHEKKTWMMLFIFTAFVFFFTECIMFYSQVYRWYDAFTLRGS